MKKEEIMMLALKEAERARDAEEVPVGAVIVRDGEVIAAAHNRNRRDVNPAAHAEMIVISMAAKFTGSERLSGCDLYVTKEPCAMCAGAIVHARLRRVVIGARDQRYGACGTVLSVCGNSLLNHVPQIEFGVLGRESADMLREFFKRRRVTAG